MKKIIVKPVITEKTLKQANELNKYTFVVSAKANKIEVASSVAEKFSVKVTAVQLMNFLGKKVKFGKKRIQGLRPDFKKAIVTLAPKNRIAIFDVK
ncbi:MAG TPA: 50S ribosomal protein L23 [Candidatus Dojkabacteria bacterium]|nr:50S ribosomal protein L23 [Candidatus Dojkabacteria bacterium]